MQLIVLTKIMLSISIRWAEKYLYNAMPLYRFATYTLSLSRFLILTTSAADDQQQVSICKREVICVTLFLNRWQSHQSYIRQINYLEPDNVISPD